MSANTSFGKNVPRPASLTYDADYKIKSILLLRYNFYDLFDNHKCYFCGEEIGSSKMFRHIQLEHTKEKSYLKTEKPGIRKANEGKWRLKQETVAKRKVQNQINSFVTEGNKSLSSSKESISQRYLANSSTSNLKRFDGLSKRTKVNQNAQNVQNSKKVADNDLILKRTPVLKLHRLEESEIKTKTTRSSTSTTAETLGKSKNNSKQPLVSNARKPSSSQSHSNTPQTPRPTEIQQTNDANSDYNCYVCDKQFWNPHILEIHLLRVHKPSIPIKLPKDFHCRRCNKSFVMKETLTRHISHNHSTSNVKKFHCEKCEEQFTFKKNLIQHIKSHHSTLKQKNVTKCNGKKIQQAQKLQSDFNTQKPNNQLKKFNCHPCKKSFFLKSSLIRHKRVHHLSLNKQNVIGIRNPSEPSKTYECDLCTNTYNLRQSFIGHKRCKHSTNLNLLQRCHICDRQFLYAYSLRRHLESHKAPEERTKFQCQHCTASFVSAGGLQYHIRVNHSAPNIKSNKFIEKRQNCKASTTKKSLKNQNKTKSSYRKQLEAMFAIQ